MYLSITANVFSLQKDSLQRSFELKCAGIDELDAKNAILSITNIIEYEKYDILSEATIGDLLAFQIK